MRRFLRCEDGARLNVDQVVRFFIQADIVAKNAKIMASALGPQMPYTVYTCDDQADAETLLEQLVTKLETEEK